MATTDPFLDVFTETFGYIADPVDPPGSVDPTDPGDPVDPIPPVPVPGPPRDVIDLPQVSVWRNTGTDWVKVGKVGNYSTLEFTPTFRDLGSWAITLPWDNAAILLPNTLVTIDWRGSRSTWLVEEWHPARTDADGSPTLTVTGSGAKGMLGWCLCWPDATNTLDGQPEYVDTKTAPFIGPAETILRNLVAGNFRDRYGANILIPATSGLGTTIKVRPKFDNLFELVQTNAKDGGIGFDIGLEDTSATHARLWMRFWKPADKTKSVRLTTRLGTVAAWEQADTAPTATHALVGYGPDLNGVQTTLTADASASAGTITVASSKNFPNPAGSTPPFRIVIGDETLRVRAVSGKTWTVDRGVGSTVPESHDSGDPVRGTRRYQWPVTTPTSIAAAAAWGGVRETYVAGPDTADPDEVAASGRASLSDGAETRALSVTAAEVEGMRAFTHYDVSDVVTMEVETGATAVANVTSIAVTVDDNGVTVNPTIGNPGSVNSTLRMGQLFQALVRRVRRNEKE